MFPDKGVFDYLDFASGMIPLTDIFRLVVGFFNTFLVNNHQTSFTPLLSDLLASSKPEISITVP